MTKVRGVLPGDQATTTSCSSDRGNSARGPPGPSKWLPSFRSSRREREMERGATSSLLRQHNLESPTCSRARAHTAPCEPALFADWRACLRRFMRARLVRDLARVHSRRSVRTRLVQRQVRRAHLQARALTAHATPHRRAHPRVASSAI